MTHGATVQAADVRDPLSIPKNHGSTDGISPLEALYGGFLSHRATPSHHPILLGFPIKKTKHFGDSHVWNALYKDCQSSRICWIQIPVRCEVGDMNFTGMSLNIGDRNNQPTPPVNYSSPVQNVVNLDPYPVFFFFSVGYMGDISH